MGASLDLFSVRLQDWAREKAGVRKKRGRDNQLWMEAFSGSVVKHIQSRARVIRMPLVHCAMKISMPILNHKLVYLIFLYTGKRLLREFPSV